MSFTEKEKQRLKRAAKKIVNMSGNKPSGDVLEMVLVLDCSVEQEKLSELVKETLTTLRTIGRPFLNMRINLIKWKNDDEIMRNVTSYPQLLMGIDLEEKDYLEADKSLDRLALLINKEYLRSRLILIASEQKYEFDDYESIKEELNPLVVKRMLFTL